MTVSIPGKRVCLVTTVDAGRVAEWLGSYPGSPKISGSNPGWAWMFVLSVCLSVFVCFEYTGTYVHIKSVESRVPTTLAYDVAQSSVGCPLRCRPRHLTRVLNYKAVLKLYLRLEIGSRKRSNQTKIWLGSFPKSKGLGFESRMGMDVYVVCMFVCICVF